MTLEKMIAQLRAAVQASLVKREEYTKAIDEVRAACVADDNRDLTEDEAAKVRKAQADRADVDAENAVRLPKIAEYEAELEADKAATRLAAEVHPTGASRPQYDGVARVGAEKRTYNPDNDKKGVQFLSDVANQVLGDFGARERLSRHMQEERVERPGYIDRAAATTAFAGLVVPQYLTDLVAPNAKAGRPFADACRHHDLPPQGMTVNISKITTGTSTALVAENTAVSETNIDDTLLSPAVVINAGQQTLSRAAIERGVGVDSTTLEDLFRAYGTKVDDTLLNAASTGLSAVATAIAYTDASPTAAELYPKLLAAPAAVEAALLDMSMGDIVAVMHSRRWYWLQSQLTSTWPIFGQPGLGNFDQSGGVNSGGTYGSGYRGLLPSGIPVIVDNNVTIAAGTTEDEIYFVAQSECHLWEDPQAPMLIRAEQTAVASLGVLLVVYGYLAYTFTRRAHAQKIGGTGLIIPVFA